MSIQKIALRIKKIRDQRNRDTGKKVNGMKDGKKIHNHLGVLLVQMNRWQLENWFLSYIFHSLEPLVATLFRQIGTAELCFGREGESLPKVKNHQPKVIVSEIWSESQQKQHWSFQVQVRMILYNKEAKRLGISFIKEF